MFDPFETLGLEKNYTIDKKVLDRHYFETLKKTHPDKLRNVTEEVKKATLQKAGEANKAYGILKDPVQRAFTLLKDAGIKPLAHDPVFLGEVLNWNERLEAGEDLREEIVKISDDLIINLTEAFQEKDFNKVRVTLYRLTYVRNLLLSMDEMR